VIGAMDATGSSRPTRAALIGLLIATGLAMLFALGPMAGSVKITIGVETQVGNASGLPDAWMLPAALEGVGAVALVFLLGRRPLGRLRVWSVGLILWINAPNDASARPSARAEPSVSKGRKMVENETSHEPLTPPIDAAKHRRCPARRPRLRGPRQRWHTSPWPSSASSSPARPALAKATVRPRWQRDHAETGGPPSA
jgi:hypothetical protein